MYAQEEPKKRARKILALLKIVSEILKWCYFDRFLFRLPHAAKPTRPTPIKNIDVGSGPVTVGVLTSWMTPESQQVAEPEFGQWLGLVSGIPGVG